MLSLITNRRSQRTGLAALGKVLRRELGHDGFAFAVTLAIGGGSALRRLWDRLEAKRSRPDTKEEDNSWLSSLNSKLSSVQKTFIANLFTSSLSILLLQAGRRRSERLRNVPRPGAIPIPYTYTPPNRTTPFSVKNSPSPTLDLTLLVLVRAIDVALQSIILKYTAKTGPETPSEESLSSLVNGKRKRSSDKRKVDLTTKLDAFVFWACSARFVDCLLLCPCYPHQRPPYLE